MTMIPLAQSTIGTGIHFNIGQKYPSDYIICMYRDGILHAKVDTCFRLYKQNLMTLYLASLSKCDMQQIPILKAQEAY